jgi:hypothetical protein
MFCSRAHAELSREHGLFGSLYTFDIQVKLAVVCHGNCLQNRPERPSGSTSLPDQFPNISLPYRKPQQNTLFAGLCDDLNFFRLIHHQLHKTAEHFCDFLYIVHPEILPNILWMTFAFARFMFDPYAHLPRINRGMVYLGACLTPNPDTSFIFVAYATYKAS